MTEVTPPAADPDAGNPPAATASWDELFAGQDPQKVREALEQSRKWETRAKENYAARQELDGIKQERLTAEEKLTARAAAAEAERDAIRTEMARYKVAAKHQLSEDDFDLLGTGTEEEIEARAKRIAELRKVSAPPPPSFDGGIRTPAPDPADMNALMRAARRG